MINLKNSVYDLERLLLLLSCETLGVKLNPYLPYIEQVTVLVVSCVSVKDQVAVSSVEVSVPFRVHRNKLQILNSPYLDTFKKLN